jgi:hypothetical protein
VVARPERISEKTVDDPAKEAKYSKSFTLYVGGDEVYERNKADGLEAELKPLVGGPIETSGSTSPSANHDAPVIGGSPSVHLAATATSKASPRRLIGVPSGPFLT